MKGEPMVMNGGYGGGNNDREQDTCFRCVKIILIVFHSLALIGLVILAVIFFVALMAISNANDKNKTKYDDYYPPNTGTIDTPNNEQMKTMGTFMGIFVSLALIFEIIVLIGIIKENKTIVFVYLVLGIIGTIQNMMYGVAAGLLSTVMVALTAYFAYMIVKRDRQMV
ncbi:unnamed protein product [Medioppia subpectinata]|uniref:Uncharacterized protein n=1 Tax=Medioppia subpectinata TaxID=1979941 RepID=A0A7R9Q7Q6_9ACAR|nr:unnamed protein product [Medioppia subpectinata]CAG2115814.1 unnamed protein product [Medioppia subpectinata]